jgi:hypothetical protein
MGLSSFSHTKTVIVQNGWRIPHFEKKLPMLPREAKSGHLQLQKLGAV